MSKNKMSKNKIITIVAIIVAVLILGFSIITMLLRDAPEEPAAGNFGPATAAIQVLPEQLI